GRGHGRELDQELDVDAELIDADHDTGDHDHALREPPEQAALTDSEALGRLLEDVARERAAEEGEHDDHDAADRRRKMSEQILGPTLEQRAAEDAERVRGED